jgi:hypothetical protein
VNTNLPAVFGRTESAPFERIVARPSNCLILGSLTSINTDQIMAFDLLTFSFCIEVNRNRSAPKPHNRCI